MPTIPLHLDCPACPSCKGKCATRIVPEISMLRPGELGCAACGHTWKASPDDRKRSAKADRAQRARDLVEAQITKDAERAAHLKRLYDAAPRAVGL